MHVYTDDEEYVIAASSEDAAAVMQETCGPVDVTDWLQMPDDRPFTVDLDDGNGPVKKTCGEWATRGRGYFCTSNH